MKLLTKELEHRFAKLGSQEDKGDDAVVIAKYFTPDSNWTWFATEYDPEDRVFWGLVDGFEVEFGPFALEEMEAATGPLGLHIERDLWWKEKPLGEVRQMLAKRRAG